MEEYIYDQLQELAVESKKRHEELSAQIKRIERSMVADRIKAAAAGALKSGLSQLKNNAPVASKLGAAAAQKKSRKSLLGKAVALRKEEAEGNCGSGDTAGDAKEKGQGVSQPEVTQSGARGDINTQDHTGGAIETAPLLGSVNEAPVKPQ